MANCKYVNSGMLHLLVLIMSSIMCNSFRRVIPPRFSTALFGQLIESVVPLQSSNEGSLQRAKKLRLDVFLSSVFSDKHSRSFLGDLCEKGSVRVNNITVKSKSHRLNGGDRVCVDLQINENDFTSVAPENIPLDIIYEDEHIIAVNKPYGMVVHPAPGSPNNTFVNALLHHLGPNASTILIDSTHQKPGNIGSADESDKFSMHAHGDVMNSEDFEDDLSIDEEVEEFNSRDNKSSMGGMNVDLPETPEAAKASPPSLRPGIVHRLDKGTSGVLLAGKHPEAVAKLSELFARRKIRKIYLAVAIGHPGETTIVEPIGRSVKNRQLMTVYDGPPGKPAITHVRTLAFDGKLSAALVRIETGRTHQIRVHLKERRTPIAGDEAYGNSDWNKRLSRSDDIHRPLLHAYETEFTHPFTNKQILLQAPVPPDMAKLMLKLTPGTEPILDGQTSLLIGSTDVKGREPGDMRGGGDFVPSDRLVIEEEHWTSFELPEEL